MTYTLSLSYGKDSLACLGAIEQLGLPLDRIIHAEVWATESIPADLPPMVEFKKHADKIIKERWGIEVEHIRSQWDYQSKFYSTFTRGKRKGELDKEIAEKCGVQGMTIARWRKRQGLEANRFCNARMKQIRRQEHDD